MRLTNYTNYALRTLIYAALRDPALVRVQDVAEAHEISRTHLVKCVHRLGQWGYLDNLRGRGGGFRLARPAAEIRIGEIVRRTEDGFAEPDPDAVAGSPDDAALDATIGRARDAFLAVLDRHTIADVVAEGEDLIAVLGLGRPGEGRGRAQASTEGRAAATSAIEVERRTSAKAP